VRSEAFGGDAPAGLGDAVDDVDVARARAGGELVSTEDVTGIELAICSRVHELVMAERRAGVLLHRLLVTLRPYRASDHAEHCARYPASHRGVTPMDDCECGVQAIDECVELIEQHEQGRVVT
jgi:hypothetical protein